MRSRGEPVESFSADAFHQASQDEEPHVGIAEPLAGRPDEVEVGEPLPGGLGPLLVIRDRIIGDQSRAVTEELIDRDGTLAVIVELGEHAAEPIGQSQLPLLDQDHN